MKKMNMLWPYNAAQIMEGTEKWINNVGIQYEREKL